MLNLYLTGEVDCIDRCAPNLIPRMMLREGLQPGELPRLVLLPRQRHQEALRRQARAPRARARNGPAGNLREDHEEGREAALRAEPERLGGI